LKALATTARHRHPQLKQKRSAIEKLERYNQLGLARLVKEDPEVFEKLAGDVVGRHVRRQIQV